jgi:hypothetical protein
VPDNGLMTADAGPEPVTTGSRRLVPGEAEAGGYRPLVAADGERHLVRDDLAGRSMPAGWRRSARPLLVIAHLSDTHVMDHQSPGRAELFDRYSDPDSPVRAAVGVIGTYRAQELSPIRWPKPRSGPCGTPRRLRYPAPRSISPS